MFCAHKNHPVCLYTIACGIWLRALDLAIPIKSAGTMAVSRNWRYPMVVSLRKYLVAGMLTPQNLVRQLLH